MRRLFLTLIILALFVCALAVPAFGASWEDTELTVINYLDYVDSSTVHVSGDGKTVKIDIPSQYATLMFENDTGNDYIRGDDGETSLEAGDVVSDIRSWPTLNMEVGRKRTKQGYLFDVSNIPSGGWISFSWVLEASGDFGWIGSNDAETPDVRYYTYYYDEPHDDGYSYEVGRGMGSGLPIVDFDAGVLECTAIYEDGVVTNGYATNYIAPYLTFRNVGVMYTPSTIRVRTSSISVTFDITDELIQMAQNEKTQKLLDEINSQLEEQGQTMKDVLAEQEQTNDKLDDMMNYQPEPETPEGGEVVGDLEDVEDNLMEDVNEGFDEAEQLQLSVLETLLQYVSAFGAVSYIFDLFAWIPFIKILLSVSLALGIVSTLLNIGLSVSSGASKSKSEGKQGAKDKYFIGPPRPPKK